MWTYNHTDEMYTGRYDRSEKLYHSDVYLGQDYSDGIQHFKYIKREKVNGKWVYYYKDDLTAKAKKNLNEKGSQYLKDLNYGGNYEIRYNNAKKDVEKYGKVAGKAASKSLKTKWHEFDKRDSLKKEHDWADGIAKKGKKDMKKYEEKIKKNKKHQAKSLADLEVAESLYGQAQRKDKGKKFLSKLLVKGLNAGEDVKSGIKKLKKKGLKGVAKDIEKGVKRTAKNVKKEWDETKNEIIDQQRYASASLRKEKSYVDTSGRIRLTEATKRGKEPMTKYMKKTGSGFGYNSYESTPKSEKRYKEYVALKDEEDRINEEYKKKRNKNKKK